MYKRTYLFTNMKVNIAKEVEAGNFKTPSPSADALLLVRVRDAISASVHDEVWDSVRSPCFDFYLDSDMPRGKIERKINNYEY